MMLDDLELELRKLPGVRSTGFDAADDILLVQLHVGPERGDPTLAAQATRIAIRHSDRPVAVEIVRWRSAPGLAPAPAPATNGTASADPGLALADPLDGALDVVEGLNGIASLPSVDRADALAGSGADDSDPSGEPDDGDPGQERIEGRRARLLAVLSFPDTDEIEVHLVVGDRRTIGRAPASGGVVAAVEATLEAIRQLGVPIAPRPRWARAVEAEADDVSLVAVAIDGEEHVHFGLAGGASAIDAAARSTLDALNRRLSLFL